MKYTQLSKSVKEAVKDDKILFWLYTYGFLNQMGSVIDRLRSREVENDIIHRVINHLEGVQKKHFNKCGEVIIDSDDILVLQEVLDDKSPLLMCKCDFLKDLEKRYTDVKEARLSDFHNDEYIATWPLDPTNYKLSNSPLYNLILLGKANFYREILDIDSNLKPFGESYMDLSLAIKLIRSL